MNNLGDKIEATRLIQGCVCKEFHEGQAPKVLANALFEELRNAISRGETMGRAIPRRTVWHQIEHLITNGPITSQAFGSAIKALKKALETCRPKDVSVFRDVENLDGAACMVYPIGGRSHLVIVWGPYRSVNTSELMLEVEFRLLPVAVEADVMSLPTGVGREPSAVPVPFRNERLPVAAESNISRALPAEIEQGLREIMRNMTNADRLFRENPHTREFIRRYMAELVERMKRASLLWALGEIETNYDDFSLLTGLVQRLRDAEELLGLTDWDGDWQWWQSAEGNHFLNANELAIRQGAIIRRIFIYKVPEDPARERFRKSEMRHHVEIGVRVRAIGYSDPFTAELMSGIRSQCVLRARDHRNTLRGWITYHVHDDDEQPDAILNRFSINPQVIRSNERVLESIWKNATPYDPEPLGKGHARAPQRTTEA